MGTHHRYLCRVKQTIVFDFLRGVRFVVFVHSGLDQTTSPKLECPIQKIKVEELFNRAILTRAQSLTHVVQISERKRDFFAVLNSSIKLDQVASRLAKHDLVLTFQGHIRRCVRPNDRKARIGLIAGSTTHSSCLVHVLKQLLAKHGLEAR